MKKETKAGLRTAIYVRVSTEEQAQEGYSIRAQVEKLKSYALLKDWEIYDLYADEGISGKNIVDRPAMNRLIEDIESGKVQNVLVFKVDRLTRSTRNLVDLIDLFEEYDCAFNSLTESIDTDTPSGRMFLKIIGIFAEFERENISERSRMGRERKVKEGYTLANCSMSYGYVKEKGQKVQEIQPDEARIVNEIFTMYVKENIAMSRIAKALNDRKIATKRNALAWDATTIKLILTNPTYIGKVRYSMWDESKYFEVDGHHESIITEELFYLAQEKINNTPQFSKTKKPRENNYFCGVLTCGMCGSKFSTHNQASKIDDEGATQYVGSYRCGRKKKYFYPDDITCKCPDISHAKVEKAFSEYIAKIPDFTETDIDIDDTAKKEDELLKYIVDCEKKADTLLNRKKKLMEQYVGEEIEFDDYKDMLFILNEKYEALEGELQRARANIPTEKNAPAVSQKEIVISIKENWEHLNDKERMMFLQRFVKKIIISVEKERSNVTNAKVEGVEYNLSCGAAERLSVRNTLSIIKQGRDRVC
ncbi:MAG: recombinase family protein [Oscillospiraceae bacterium]|nr:recombinase family protein [Oscillospiraceae bacterium]